MKDPLLGGLDSVVNNILPILIISIANFIVVFRVIYQKRRLNQANIWRKQRKMTIQLLCSSLLYLVPSLPLNSFFFAYLCGLPKTTGIQVQLYFNFLTYFIILLYPFVCLGSLPDLYKKIKWKELVLLIRPRQIATVRPA